MLSGSPDYARAFGSQQLNRFFDFPVLARPARELSQQSHTNAREEKAWRLSPGVAAGPGGERPRAPQPPTSDSDRKWLRDPTRGKGGRRATHPGAAVSPAAPPPGGAPSPRAAPPGPCGNSAEGEAQRGGAGGGGCCGTPAPRPLSRRPGAAPFSLPAGPSATSPGPARSRLRLPASPDPPCPGCSPEGGPLPRRPAVRGRRAAAPFVEELLEQGGGHAAALPLPPPPPRPRRQPHRASRSGSAGGERRRPRQHPRRRGAAQHCAEAKRGEHRPAQPRRSRRPPVT